MEKGESDGEGEIDEEVRRPQLENEEQEKMGGGNENENKSVKEEEEKEEKDTESTEILVSPLVYEEKEGQGSKNASETTETEKEGEEGEELQSWVDGEDDDFEDEDEDTVSSEAIVDDIELILLPEEVQELPNLSPKLVRVTELSQNHNMNTILDTDQGDDEDEEGEEEDYAGEGCSTSTGRKKSGGFFQKDISIDFQRIDSEEHFSRSFDDDQDQGAVGGVGPSLSSNKVNSGVQTELTALETREVQMKSRRFGDFHHPSGPSSSNLSKFSLRSSSGGTKRINWKSELNLLPSKCKISDFGNFGNSTPLSYRSTDQYSPRVTKFTSQDNVLSSSSQFLKPTTLYRTRNLSRNLNRFASTSETDFQNLILPEQGDLSPRYRTSSSGFGERIAFSSSASTFKGYSFIPTYLSSTPIHLKGQIAASNLARNNFRASLPDLSGGGPGGQTGGDYKRRIGSTSTTKHMRHSTHQRSSSVRLHKKLSSESEEETSSLIDESESCLRKSIDLLLTDDYVFTTTAGGGEFTNRSVGTFAYQPTSSRAASTSGYSSVRRSASQPILSDFGYQEPKDAYGTFYGMGTPFLPRKVSDMRLVKYCKVILSNNQVAVVAVKEIDELRSNLTIVTDTGCIISLPFRKVIFAWHSNR